MTNYSRVTDRRSLVDIFLVVYANGGEDLAGAGLTVALPVRLARVSSGGPARALPWRANFPSKDLAGGLVGFFGEDGCLPILI